MVDKIEIGRTLKGSFTVSEITLANICRHLAEAIGRSVSISVRFANSRTISTDDLAAIFLDSSVANHKIELVRLTCGSFTDENQATVTLGIAEDRPVTIEIKGDRRLAIALEDSIVNEMKGVRSPLWVLNTYQWPGVDVNFALSIITLLMISFVAAIYMWGDQLTVIGFSFFPLVLIPLCSSLFGVAGPFIAPSIVFGFGRGASSERRRRTALNTIFVAVVLGSVVGLVVNYLSGQLLPN